MQEEKSMYNVAICGYGNLGKGVEKALMQNSDMNLVGIFSRRPKEVLNTESKVLSMENIGQYEKEMFALYCYGTFVLCLVRRRSQCGRTCLRHLR